MLKRGMLAEVLPLVLERTAQNVDLLWPDRFSDGSNHLLVRASALVLNQLAAATENGGPLKLSFTTSQLRGIVAAVLDEVVTNVSLMLQKNNKPSIVEQALSVALSVLQNAQDQLLSAETAKNVLIAVVRAVAMRPEFLNKAQGILTRISNLEKILDRLVELILSGQVTLIIQATLARGDAFSKIVSAVLERLAQAGITDTMIRQSLPLLKMQKRPSKMAVHGTFRIDQSHQNCYVLNLPHAMRISMIHPTLPSNIVRLPHLLLFLCLILLSSCVTIEHARDLREAQDLFNMAAELENQLTMDASANESITKSGRISSGYTTSLAMVSFLIEKRKTTFVKTTCWYRLCAQSPHRMETGPIRCCSGTAQTAASSNATFFARDEALLSAISGLIKNDMAYQQMTLKSGDYTETIAMFSTAIAEIGQGISDNPSVHHIRLYLLTSQLASLKNWLDLFSSPEKYDMVRPEGATPRTERASWCEQAAPTWENFDNEVTRLGTTDATALKRKLLACWACRAPVLTELTRQTG